MPTHPIDRHVHTLGPHGTNCEAAARHWTARRGQDEERIVLHRTLEDAALGVMAHPQDSVLLGCVVYPRLHEIVFNNLGALSLSECFVFPTHNMVLAARHDGPLRSILSHDAPAGLAEGRGARIASANSNAEAAERCAAGDSDGCITTIVAARSHRLRVVADFGPVPMGFSIHAPRGIHL